VARSELQRLFENGLISECEYRRARGSKKMLDEYAGDYGLTTGPSGPKEYGANELRDRKTQRNDAPGGGRTVEFGPSDASFGRNQIDNKENRPTRRRGSKTKGASQWATRLPRNWSRIRTLRYSRSRMTWRSPISPTTWTPTTLIWKKSMAGTATRSATKSCWRRRPWSPGQRPGSAAAARQRNGNRTRDFGPRRAHLRI
jgi:hypothetical protein